MQADSLPSESPGKPMNTGVGSLSLLQGIVPTQESNWGPLGCRWILYQLSYQGHCTPIKNTRRYHHFPNSLVKNPLQRRRPWFDSWVGKICWRRGRLPTPVFLGFPCGSAGKESACNARDLGFNTWVGKIPWRKERLPIPVFWPGEFHGHSP